jgi:hypothetical protein
VLRAWSRRRALRRESRKTEEKARAAEVRERTEALVEEIVGPYVRDGLATIEKTEYDEIVGPEIRVIPKKRTAAGMAIDPMLNWVAVAVEYGSLEIFIGEREWEEELARYLRSVLEGDYREVGKKTRLGPSVKMIFGRSDGDDLTCTGGGLYQGADRDYPSGERQYSSYR